jgi:ribosomal protein S12 methylthiotransferase
MSPAKKTPRIGMISLGCAKNLVDAEVMLGSAKSEGFEITRDPAEADILVVNTCGFIDSAKQESIDAILEANRQRNEIRPEAKLVVSGCLSQRYSGDLAAELPEVDAFIGLDQVPEAGAIFRRVLDREPNGVLNLVTPKSRYIPDFATPRFRLTPSHSAYVKIAEGCNHPCSFCVIPQMRGRHRSRPLDSVVREIRSLVAEGVKEINLISQDTTYFGMDRWTDARPNPRSKVDSSKGESLASLLRELDQIEGDFWVRLLYTHPAHWSDELIETIGRSKHVVRYVDIPLQHVSDKMLGAMQRETDGAYIRDLIKRMRAGIPDLVIRTTFIVGFPGETEEDFTELLAFLEETKFDRVGVFKYSKEEGTKGAKMEGHLSDEVKADRHARAMLLLQRLSKQRGEAFVGRKLRVLVESPGVARSTGDAMEIDGIVKVPKKLAIGQFAEVTVTGAEEYDLIAK